VTFEKYTLTYTYLKCKASCCFDKQAENSLEDDESDAYRRQIRRRKRLRKKNRQERQEYHTFYEGSRHTEREENRRSDNRRTAPLIQPVSLFLFLFFTLNQ
jgi:hypothetical protein